MSKDLGKSLIVLGLFIFGAVSIIFALLYYFPTDGGPSPSYCGDNVCVTGETCSNCPADCGTCPSTKYCGDDVCLSGEDCSNCPIDCGECPTQKYCGNYICEPGEDCNSCSIDCGDCPPTCSDECYTGQIRCSGSWSQICGNFDYDECLEFKNAEYCQWGCTNGLCIIHDIDFTALRTNLKNPIKWAEYEKQHDWYIQNEIYIDIKNNGNVDENLRVYCDGTQVPISQNIYVPAMMSKFFKFNFDIDYETINCVIENEYISERKSFVFASQMSDWYFHDMTNPGIYLYCDAMPDCNHPSIKALAEQLRRVTPDATVFNVMNWIDQNMEYNTYYLTHHWFPKASEVYQERGGVCSQLTMFLAGVLRAQGIPTATVSGCVFLSTCEWWDLRCMLRGVFLSNPNHAWTYVWINGDWHYADPTVAAVGMPDRAYPNHLSGAYYYRDDFCNDYLSYSTQGDCWTYVPGVEGCL